MYPRPDKWKGKWTRFYAEIRAKSQNPKMHGRQHKIHTGGSWEIEKDVMQLWERKTRDRSHPQFKKKYYRTVNGNTKKENAISNCSDTKTAAADET